MIDLPEPLLSPFWSVFAREILMGASFLVGIYGLSTVEKASDCHQQGRRWRWSAARGAAAIFVGFALLMFVYLPW